MPFPELSAIPVYGQVFGWIGQTERNLEFGVDAFGQISLRVSGAATISLSSDGAQLFTSTERESLPLLEREIILGPALVLALALNKKWSLHASAAIYNERKIAFLGESGQGKSTLAAWLGQHGWQHLADDILPVRASENGIDALPHFPQLKLPADAQPGLNFPESLPLDALCLLQKADAAAAPDLRLLPPKEAVRIILSHTAGTRLFTPELLAQHLHFAAHAAESLPVYALTYPHDKAKLGQMKALLEEEFKK